MTTYVVTLIVLLFLSALFSSSETAFLSIQRVRLEHMLREGVRGAERVARLLERPRSLLSAILLGNNLVNTGAAAVGTAIATQFVSGGAAVLAATIVITVLLVVLGEVIPKSIALTHSFALSRAYAVPIGLWARLARPAVWGLDKLAAVMLRLVDGADTIAGDTAISAAELRTVIRLGLESGAIERDESSRLLGALTLEQRAVREIMSPRVDMVAAQIEEPLTDVARRLGEAGFLRLPIYDRSPDDVVGYVHVSDLNTAHLEGIEAHTTREVMRPPVFESEHASIARVLELMQERASYLVMLVDEFGATSGLVTLEDIMEEVVGRLRSESGEEAVEEERRDGGPLVVEGGRLLVDLSNELEVDMTDVEANTVAGLVLAYLRHFPQPGEYVDHEGYRFTVVESDERRVLRVSVEPARAEPDGDQAGAAGAGGE